MPINIRPNNKPSPKIINVDDPGDPEVDQPQRRRINRDHRISHEGLEVISVEVLKLDPKRAKTHPESQIAELARSIEKFGFNDPIEIDQNNTIVAGVGRYGEMTSAEFIRFQETVCAHLRDHMEPGAVAYMCMDHRHLLELRLAADRVFGDHKNMCVWLKPNAGMGSFYRSQHELVMVYAAPGRVKNNFGLGGTGRHRSNVWTYPGLSSFGRDRDETLAMHPTVKPVAMIADALRDCSDRGDIVLDPFGGSGSTLIAAERTRRRARLMEIDPLYCDCIIRRWQKLTGNAARLADSNETFGEAEVRRGAGQ